MTVLRTDRLILRRPEPRDAAALVAYYETDRSRGNGGPLAAPDAWRTMAVHLGHWDLRGYGMWALTRPGDGTMLGMAGPWFPLGWGEPEIGWMLFHARDEGTGLAYEAALAARGHAYFTLGWPVAVSYVAPWNTRSANLARRLGARPDGSWTSPRGSVSDVWRHPSAREAAA